MVPREERPSLDDLEDYTESRFERDTDYSMYRIQLRLWLNDFRREKEQVRSDQQGDTQPLFGHQIEDDGQVEGYDAESFDIHKIRKRIRQSPKH